MRLRRGLSRVWLSSKSKRSLLWSSSDASVSKRAISLRILVSQSGESGFPEPDNRYRGRILFGQGLKFQALIFPFS